MDWSERGVPGVWEHGDIKKIVCTPRHVVLHRKDDSGPLYLSLPVALAAYGEALKIVDAERKAREKSSAQERQRAALVRDKKLDYAVLAAIALIGAVAVVLAWLR